MRTPIIAVAALLAAAPGFAKAAEPPCLTRAEFSALASYAMPSVISGANARCEPVFAPDAYLETDGDKLVERYESRKDTSWPAARNAFLKISSKSGDKANDLLDRLPDETLQDMVDLMIEGLVSQAIPPEKCVTIDEFARLLAPLPPENTSDLIALIVELAGRPKKDGTGKSAIGKLAICQE